MIALPERVSNTGLLGGMLGPEERVGCKGGLARPGRVEEASLVASLAWKRAMMDFTSALLSWREQMKTRQMFLLPAIRMGLFRCSTASFR